MKKEDIELGYAIYGSPVGEILIVVGNKGVEYIMLWKEEWELFLEAHPNIEENKAICEPVITQLKEYFCGQRKTFNLPLGISSTPFREGVWEAVHKIPYGEVRSYKEIAYEIGNPKAVRAVGQANKVNPLPILIPCHRVIGATGKLVGYGGNRIGIKERLLLLEKEYSNK